MTQEVAMAASATPKKRNPLALFFGMIIRPRDTLTYLRDFGGLSWIWPAGLALILLVVNLIVSAPITGVEAQKQLETMKANYTEQQYQQVVAMATNPLIIIVTPAIMGVLGLIVVWLIRGGIYYLANLGLGGQGKFGAMFRMVVWVALPDIVRDIVKTVGTAVTGRVMQSGLAALVTVPEGKLVPPMDVALWQAFLKGIDIFWLWGIALTIIGIAATAKVSGRKAVLIVVGLWVLAVAANLGFTWFGLYMSAQMGYGG